MESDTDPHALDQHTGCVLSETAIASDTNEAKTAVEFLKTLVLEGKTVVGDAGFCQRDICETNLSGHVGYLILVKDNQPTLHKEAIQAFVIPEGFSPYAKRKAREARRTATTIEKSHGRIERRTLTTTTVGTDTCDWPGLRQFLKLERETTVKGETKTTVAYAITSRSVASSTAEQVLALWDREQIVLGEGCDSARRPGPHPIRKGGVRHERHSQRNYQLHQEFRQRMHRSCIPVKRPAHPRALNQTRHTHSMSRPV